MKVFENPSHLSECGAVEGDAVKSLDKYACHENEVVLIYFKIELGKKNNTSEGFREAFFWAFSH